MPHLRSQRTGHRSAWKSPVAVQIAHQNLKNTQSAIMKVETATSAPKKCSLFVKPSMSLQYIDEGSEKRLEAAFKSVITYSLGTEKKNFAEENVPDTGEKQNCVINASTVDSNSLPKIGIKSRVIKKKKLPSAKTFDGIVFSLGSDKQSDLAHLNPVHRCKTCSLSCHDLSGEFWGFPKSDVNTDIDSSIAVDDPGSYCHGFDLAEDEIGEFYGFEKFNNHHQEFIGQLEVSGLKPCSVVLYKVKPCSVVLHRLKYTSEKNVGPYNWQFPPENGKLARRVPRKQSVISRTVDSMSTVTIKQEAEDVDYSRFTFHDDENNFLFESMNNISVTVWDQFQDACNLSLQKEYIDDFCGFAHLNSH